LNPSCLFDLRSLLRLFGRFLEILPSVSFGFSSGLYPHFFATHLLIGNRQPFFLLYATPVVFFSFLAFPVQKQLLLFPFRALKAPVLKPAVLHFPFFRAFILFHSWPGPKSKPKRPQLGCSFLPIFQASLFSRSPPPPPLSFFLLRGRTFGCGFL